MIHKLLATFLLAGIVAAPASALPDDRQQPIRITADEAVRNEKEGFTVYTGNVEMIQGSLRVQANRITIYRIQEEGDKIVAMGHPATMQQQPDADSGLVKARARVIEYFKGTSRVLLKQEAEIEQKGSTVTGDIIDYYIDKQLVKAVSNRASEDSRVEVLIPAGTVNEDGSDNGPTDSE